MIFLHACCFYGVMLLIRWWLSLRITFLFHPFFSWYLGILLPTGDAMHDTAVTRKGRCVRGASEMGGSTTTADVAPTGKRKESPVRHRPCAEGGCLRVQVRTRPENSPPLCVNLLDVGCCWLDRFSVLWGQHQSASRRPTIPRATCGLSVGVCC